MKTLKLTTEEKKRFDQLSAELRDGWKIEDETLTAKETPEELEMRTMMFDSEDPSLKQLLTNAKKVKDSKNWEEIARELGPLPPDVTASVFFTLGVDAITSFVEYFLSNIKSDKDIEGVADITTIRHMLLETNAEAPSFLI